MAEPDKLDIARKYLLDKGKCASVSQNDHLCTIVANHLGRRHKAQITGGPDDGLTVEEWDW